MVAYFVSFGVCGIAGFVVWVHYVTTCGWVTMKLQPKLNAVPLQLWKRYTTGCYLHVFAVPMVHCC